MKLGCGFHYDHIRDVIHMDIAYSIVDQLQEDSRGGQDGFPCWAITFIYEGSPCPKNNNAYDLGAAAVYQWSQEREKCLRIAPSLFLDNVPITCSLIPGAQLCAHCTAQLMKKPPVFTRSLSIPPSSNPTNPINTVSVPFNHTLSTVQSRMST